MKILSIDPGYDRCGVALVSGNNPLVVEYSTCITTDKKMTHEVRLWEIYRQVLLIAQEKKPDAVALETLFFSVNKKTALLVAEARGVVALVAGALNIPLVELSPQEVKVAMTGVGNATKEQVQKMVSLSLSIDVASRLDDEIDAIALGVAALQKTRVENLQKPLAKKK